MSPDIHPAANIFPMMSDAAFAELKSDIEKNGQQEPVVYFRGQLLDGRNRDRACRELGIKASECELDESDDPLAYVLSANLHRRHLDESQRGMIGGRIKSYHSEMAQVRKKANGGDKRSVKAKQKTEVENLPPPIKARDAAAAVVNVSGKTVDHATTVLSKGSPDLIAKVDAGEVSVSRAAKIAKEVPKAKQAAVAETKPDKTKQKTPFDHLREWWKKADGPARARFRLWIDGECS